MISIKLVELQNFLGYGNYKTIVNLEDYQGVALVTGEYEDNVDREDGDEKFAGVGKTSIFEAIVWCLFGHLLSKERPGDSVVNWNTGSNCIVKVTTTDGYEIIRTRKFKGMNELVVTKDGSVADTLGTSTPTQEYLNSLFGIDYNTFVTSVVFGQFSEGFLSVTDSKRRKILERLMRLSSFTDIAKASKTRSDIVKNDVENISKEVSNIELSISSIVFQIDDYSNKVKEHDESKSAKIQSLKDKISTIKSEFSERFQNIKSEIDKIDEDLSVDYGIEKAKECINEYNELVAFIKEQKDRRESIKDEISSLHQKLISSRSAVFDIPDIDFEKAWSDYNDAIEKLNKNTATYRKLLIEIDRMKQKIKDIDSYVKKAESLGDICGECGQDVNDGFVRNRIDSKLLDKGKLDKMLSKLSGQIDRYAELTSIVVEKPEYTVECIDRLMQQNAILENDIEKLDKEIQDKEEELKEISECEYPDKPEKDEVWIEVTKNKVENLKSQKIEKVNELSRIKDELKSRISDINQQISDVEKEENPYVNIISDLKSKQLEQQAKLEFALSGLRKKKLMKAHLDYISASYSNKKKMRAYWIGQLVPDLNKLIRYYLDIFEVDDSIKFDEFLAVKMNRWDYITHSGGERKSIDLSIMFALNDLHTQYFGQQANILILDEVDARIDPFTMNRLSNILLNDICQRDGMSNIFVVSHREVMKDRFPHKIQIKNKMGYSYIESQS
jgi:DNA repair exonuclease SbcCD ATPase subunit